MIRTVGLEMRWLPKDIGSLFIKGKTYESIEYWYYEIKKTQKDDLSLLSRFFKIR